MSLTHQEWTEFCREQLFDLAEIKRLLAPSPKRANDQLHNEGHMTQQLPAEEKAQREWRNSAALQAEFVDFDVYLAFAKAEAAGLVNVLIGATKSRGAQ